MFTKIVRTTEADGRTHVSYRSIVQDHNLVQDKAYESERIRNLARTSENARIQSVEDTERTVVVIYSYGRIKTYHWVAA